jgi:glycine dehydrogenase subunit 1
VAALCVNKAHYLKESLCTVEGAEIPFDRPFFMEFPLKFGEPARVVFDRLCDRKIFAGVPTSRFMWEDDYLLVCATEKRTRAEMDQYRHALQEILVKDAVLP